MNEKENMSNWSLEKLRRKHHQAHDMAALARKDGDTKDMQRRLDEAAKISAIIRERV